MSLAFSQRFIPARQERQWQRVNCEPALQRRAPPPTHAHAHTHARAKARMHAHCTHARTQAQGRTRHNTGRLRQQTSTNDTSIKATASLAVQLSPPARPAAPMPSAFWASHLQTSTRALGAPSEYGPRCTMRTARRGLAGPRLHLLLLGCGHVFPRSTLATSLVTLPSPPGDVSTYAWSCARPAYVSARPRSQPTGALQRHSTHACHFHTCAHMQLCSAGPPPRPRPALRAISHCNAHCERPCRAVMCGGCCQPQPDSGRWAQHALEPLVRAGPYL